MKIKDGYLKAAFFGDSYLIPYGQNIIEHKKSFRLNESSEFLLELLTGRSNEQHENNNEKVSVDEKTLDDIVDAFAKKYKISDDETDNLRSDLEEFILQLELKGIIEKSGNCFSDSNDTASCNFYKIGPLYVEIDGEKDLIHEYFEKFSEKKVCPDLRIRLLSINHGEQINGTVLVQNDEVIITCTDREYEFLFPKQEEISRLCVSKDGMEARLFYNCCGSQNELREAIFHTMRFAFLVCAYNNDLTVVHSASVLYKNMAWLFSGSSGTGKSTHTALWHELCGAPFINGDLNMIGIKNGKAVVYGLPWCGTSEIYSNEEYELGGIIFLKQHQKDSVYYPAKSEAVILLLQRIITPLWTKEMLEKSLDLIKQLVEHSNIFRLYCTKNISAAKVMKNAIDEKLSNTEKQAVKQELLK